MRFCSSPCSGPETSYRRIESNPTTARFGKTSFSNVELGLYGFGLIFPTIIYIATYFLASGNEDARITHAQAVFTVGSDFLIAFSYFLIPFAIVYVLKKRGDIPFNWMFCLFAAFIVCCGGTHVMAMFRINESKEVMVIKIFMKVITAIISFITALSMLKIIPLALSLPTPAQFEEQILEKKRTQDLLESQQLCVQLMQQAAADAEILAKMKSSLIANISHELRTPMNAIIGNTELLKDSKLDSEQLPLVEVILQSGEALLSVINNVLDITKVETVKRIDNTSFSIMELLDSCTSVISAQSRKKDLDVVCSIGEDVPEYVNGDKNRLRQVLTNLLSNAVKFTPSGRISVLIERYSTPAGVEEPVTLLWKVQDTGIGISEAGRELLFKPFSQVDSGSDRGYEGTGLGLYLCKEFVEHILGGKIWCDSIPNQGSSFQFTTQLKIDKSIDPSKQRSLAGKRFFIAGMNVTNSQMISMALKRWGAEISTILNPMTTYDGCIVNANSYSESVLHSLPKPLAMNLVEPISFVQLYTALTNPSSEEVPKPKSDERPEKSLAILVTEDNKINQKVIKSLLSSLGQKDVEIAENGFEALEALKKKKYELVFMDIHMPKLSGFECTQRIRNSEDKSISTIPIVGLTADVAEDSKTQAFACGMTAYVTKPIKRAELHQLLLQFTRDVPTTKPISVFT